jgi:hypothetical protein
VALQKLIRLGLVAGLMRPDTSIASDHCGQRRLTDGHKIATDDRGQVILVKEGKLFGQEWGDGSAPSLGFLEGECDDCDCCITLFCVGTGVGGWPMIGNKWKCFKDSNSNCRCGCSVGCL